jgi:hypothetical protein
MAIDKISFMKLELRPSRDIITPPPPIVPFADWDYYYTTQPLGWRANPPVEGMPASVTVPTGFVTDLASIPAIFWSLLPPGARYSYPAIIHDYLYWFQPCKRAQADAVFKAAMEDMRVPPAKIAVIYNAVHLAGQPAWENNKTLREAGEKRVLKIYPTDALTSWTVWKSRDVFI